MASKDSGNGVNGTGRASRLHDLHDEQLGGVVPASDEQTPSSPPRELAPGEREIHLVRDPGSRDKARQAVENRRDWAVQKIQAPPDDERLEMTCPNLWEGLTMTRYADGTARLPYEIKVVMVNGAYSVTLTDHDTLQKLTVLAGRWEEIGMALETSLTSVAPPWVQMDKSFKNKKGLDKFKRKT